MPEFVPGLELCRLFYEEAIQPLLAKAFPDLRYSAALLGSGSETLGFDTEMSTDHDWGPRGMLFLTEEDQARHREALYETLRRELPTRFRGYPTDFLSDEPAQDSLIQHRVEILSLRGFVLDYLGFDIEADIAPADWLTFPEQKLRAFTAGAVYHDALGLQTLRERFAYYPRDVWLYLLAAGWNRIGQEEHLMGRAGFVGDEIGSALIGARLVRDLMRLCFLMEQQYAPYPKWFGTAFQQLACAPELAPLLRSALAAETWQERQEPLAAAYEVVAERHNQLQITAPLPTRTTDFFNRPFRVIGLHGFVEAICGQITDPAVKRIADRRLIGGIDQISDNTDILTDTCWRKTLLRLYE